MPICERTTTDSDRTIDLCVTLRVSRDRCEENSVEASQEPAKYLLATHIIALEEKIAKISKDIHIITKQIIKEMRS